MSEQNSKQTSFDVQQPLEKRFEEVSKPFSRFIHNQTTGAMLLLGATLLALILANTSFQPLYAALE